MQQMKREADVKAAVKKVLEKFHKDAWYFMPVPTGFGTQGVPDFICCIKGRFIGIETKFGGNKMTEWQQRTQLRISEAGGTVLLITENNVGGLEATIRAMVELER